MKLSGAVLAVAAVIAAGAADAPPSAGTLIDRAKAEAAPNHRAIFVVFGATW